MQSKMIAPQFEGNIVAHPLSPSVLAKLGGLKQWPPVSQEFDPHSSWQHTFRIWICHGYTNRGNENIGLIRLARTPEPGGLTFRLSVRQTILHVGGIRQSLDADITCRNDLFGSPIDWHLENRFFRGDRLSSTLSNSLEGRRRGDRIELSTGDSVSQMNRVKNVGSDWSVFDAVQRWPFQRSQSPTFDLLENLTVRRSGQRIFYRGVENFHHEGRDLRLHHFVQLGPGMLPYDYWLDRQRRLVLVTTFTRAYILDSNYVLETAGSASR